MTVKKCDKCGKIYEKGYLLAYSLNGCEVGKAEGVLKPEYAVTKDLCETCATRLKMFLRNQKREYEQLTKEQDEHLVTLEKENTRLKLELEALDGQIPWKDIKDKSEVLGKLTKAKELLNEFLDFESSCIERGIKISDKIRAEAEQFLKDCDIDNAIQQANKGLDFDKIADEMKQDLKDSEVEK